MTGPTSSQRQQMFEAMLFNILDEHDTESVAFKNANDFIFFIGKVTNNMEYITLSKAHDKELNHTNLSEFGFRCLERLGYFNIQYQMSMPA